VFKSKRARIIMVIIRFSEGFYLLFIPAKTDAAIPAKTRPLPILFQFLCTWKCKEERAGALRDTFRQSSRENAVQNKAVGNARLIEDL